MASLPPAPDEKLCRALLAPRSVAVVGASERPGSVGAAVFANLVAGGFPGNLFAVNPKHNEVLGRRCYPDVTALPAAPDLLVVCTPPDSVPEVLAAAAARGTPAAVVLSAGVDAQALLQAVRPLGLRVVGPNCVGLRAPRVSLNASFSSIPARAGSLALLAQSGGVITAFLDWADRRGVGLSCCVSLGNSVDLTAADLLDALAADEQTRAILLYLESARDGRRLLEAAARAARVKPVFALKVGRVREGAAAAATHTGALAGADNVWEAALRAAGVRRLGSLEELYGVAELLERLPRPPTREIALVTNSGGPAVLAVDALIAGGGALVPLGESTLRALDAVLPATWSHRNPVDIIGDATPPRFIAALEPVTADPAVNTTLVMHVPTDLCASADVRRLCNAFAVRTRRNLVGCWIGEATEAGEAMPAFATPEQAVTAIVHVAQAEALRKALPPGRFGETATIPSSLHEALHACRRAGHTLAPQALVEQVLATAGIPFAPVRLVAQADALPAVAAQLGYPVVLKIQSPDIPHKSDVGGVVTNVADEAALREAAAQILQRCARQRPDARIDGFQIQRQVVAAHARELIVGLARDAEFGPVVLFGHGGTAVHVYDDTAIGIPPLDDAAAADVIAHTRVSRLLAAWRDWPAADLAAVQQVLSAVGGIGEQFPEIAALDINPLVAHPGGVIALDARVQLA